MDFAEKVKRVYWLRKESERLKQEADEILDSIGGLTIRNYPAGDFILQVTRTKRFDAATAVKYLTPDQVESISKMTPNASLAKGVLSEDDYKKTQKDYGLTRKIIPVTDMED